MQPGSKRSHYEIHSPLGAGAMGEVWRAKDTRLGREVAIKVLPEHFAADAERLRRSRSCDRLFDLGLPQPGTARNTFDLFPDGKSLVLLRAQQSAATTVHVQTGWRAF